jgi:hypothetical protein
MIPLVAFPEVVRRYAPFFADVFSAEAFIEFKRYISGLIVSENQTVAGINQLFVFESRNQSSLNRLLTASPFSLAALNQARLAVLASVPATRRKPQGVLSVDDTLLTHYGQDFEQIAQLFDHVSDSYVWAHDVVTLHYSDDDTDYPLLFQLWKPVDVAQLEKGLRAAQVPLKASKAVLKETAPRKWRGYLLGVWQRRQKQQPELRDLYDSKLSIAQALLQQWVTAHPDEALPVTFDNWFTQPAFCRFLDQSLHLAYVGTLADGDKVSLKTGQETLQDFAGRLKQEHLEAVAHGGQAVFRRMTIPYRGEQETYYSYCQTHNIHNFGKQRLVINHGQADLADSPTFFISNRLVWQAAGITRIRRHRWPVEPAIRFRKQRLYWTLPNFQSSEQCDRWTDLVSLVQWELYLARPLVEDCPLPWQKKRPLRLTPGRVQQGLGAIIAAMGTPAQAPQPRGKSPGWRRGRVRQRPKRHPVVKKTPKKATQQGQKRQTA